MEGSFGLEFFGLGHSDDEVLQALNVVNCPGTSISPSAGKINFIFAFTATDKDKENFQTFQVDASDREVKPV